MVSVLCKQNKNKYLLVTLQTPPASSSLPSRPASLYFLEPTSTSPSTTPTRASMMSTPLNPVGIFCPFVSGPPSHSPCCLRPRLHTHHSGDRGHLSPAWPLAPSRLPTPSVLAAQAPSQGLHCTVLQLSSPCPADPLRCFLADNHHDSWPAPQLRPRLPNHPIQLPVRDIHLIDFQASRVAGSFL